MKNYPDTQLDFLNDPAPKTKTPKIQPPLVIELDHRSWMRFLSEEWLYPDKSGGVLLGVGEPCETAIPSNFTAVGVCFDHAKLPDSNVMAWREGSWISVSLSNVGPSDKAILWNGPLPLFAVGRFTMPSHETRAHLLAQVRNFADIESPQQPVEVISGNKIKVPTPARKNFPFGTKQCPENWNLFRGAAAMALECVPAIGPWLQVLCDSLSKDQPIASAKIVDAPWLAFTPWTPNDDSDGSRPSLWRAIIEVFSYPETRENWRSDVVLHTVCNKARLMGGDIQRLSQLEESTEKLLKDLGNIRDLGIKDDLLELAFQLILLRHTPERFVTWKKDWPSIAPGAWWTGAILAGYLCGFRSLPLHLRGNFEARKFLALRTWQLVDEKSSCDWKTINQGSVNWLIEDDQFHVKKGSEIIALHKVSNRGRWYELDFGIPLYRDSAENVATQFCPELIKRTLVLDEGSYDLAGDNNSSLDLSKAKLQVNGRFEIILGPQGELKQSLDIKAFRNWLATSSLQSPIPNPPTVEKTKKQTNFDTIETPVLNLNPRQPISARNASKRTEVISETPPKGLLIIQDFITPKEESSFLASIEKAPWDSSMTRRVQHYGWRYDYKARKILPSAYLGPLPKWAESLGKRLVKEKYLSELPDQVIVNEYLGNQSISKHIDCIPCFRGAVVTISLLESWEMVFSRKTKLDAEEKYKVVLNRRSAAVLGGESRSDWYHEIPRRSKEAGILRERRISITFRKVDTAP
ncbi:alpha-ketoglutarate-dependent dioxygenase AlkB [Pseudomonas rossensis]|uniref:alpha-ketoglutarate-dependent dioxygenase AlkB n=1 Tax=Pseudomonas rossensis TaxID=2305471 RepID=UPI003261B87C